MKKVILLLALLPLMVFGQKCMSDEYNATKTFKTDRSSIADEDEMPDDKTVYVNDDKSAYVDRKNKRVKSI